MAILKEKKKTHKNEHVYCSAVKLCESVLSAQLFPMLGLVISGYSEKCFSILLVS